jgi:hypothetical protein
MKFGFFVFILVFVLRAIPAPAFELSKPQREERGLNIELESSESPAQPDFDKYVRELAAAAQAAQRDAKSRESQQQEDALKNQQAKTLNPIVIFRW